MLAELGNFAMLLALLLATALTVFPLVGAQRGNVAWMRLARPLAYGQTLLIAISYVLLTWVFVQHDLSVAYVANNSHHLLPLVYKISGVWGAHEGSLLLWVLILAVWISAVARFSRDLPLPVVARVLAVMGFVSVGFLSFTAFTSNPFERLLPAAAVGQDLNPLLQDPGLIFHPPLLYAGYVGFAVAFGFAVAALLDGRVDAQWVRWSRPWTNVAWGFLTLGILLGSYWAYYELGWGGWWFWDPVENASFMPWLAGLALIHSQAVSEKRGSFHAWTLLLAIAAFSLSLLGAFLVRSGVLTSVHAFATDPQRGMYILAFLAVVVGGSLALYALRAPKNEGKPFVASSRETLLLANNLLMTAATIMILLGTLYPLLIDALGLGQISVGAPFFGVLFTLLMTPVVLLIPFGPLSRWGHEENMPLLLRLMLPWFVLSLIVLVLVLLFWPNGTLRTAAGFAGGLWVLAGVGVYLWRRLKVQRQNLTAENVGMVLAHAGLGVFVVGVLVLESTQIQRDVAARPGMSFEVRGYSFEFVGVEERMGPNFVSDFGTVRVSRDGELVATLHPEKRHYKAGGQVMTEASYDPGIFRDVYVALGDPLDANRTEWAVRLYVKPFIRWIWIGALLMAIGSFVVAFDRRFRRRVSEAEAVPAASRGAPA
ncbi:heme lyase CcmF/NrfE family subunit [Silanimonas sp.]|uniref:heme lyase CcmF/NrfE family subunit n=1 Tax=Silanimonas sp. TaxID=1929290 RepID=UPI001BB9D1FE|nr:heme lyase CcmF/NrfE family subunit [Silanimonas sp.]MBS3896332.1 heme lyase CcmF/NrfE family subunit [Silanimonas sp.]MBS3923761.1 heme lyase CcmF/NrfE family subunit [Xanthomonadaceae bacterium]